MKKILWVCAFFIHSQVIAATYNFPSYHNDFPPSNEVGTVFSLSQNYPQKLVAETYPWDSIDFEKKPTKFLKSVLSYCLEGNIEANFIVQNNKVRKWYHAPWLHSGRNGREYIHGLTRERGTPKFEVHRSQDVRLENWAVGFYNPAGGYTLGQVWDLSEGYPQPKKANFPEGTVSCKLLFTAGAVDKVPFLDKSLAWDANIYPSSNDRTKRVNKKVTLFQIDVAVKDKRAKNTGWVFGTFIYDASNAGETVWERMVPVGLSWGDDECIKSKINKDGAFINSELKQSYINEDLIENLSRTYTSEAYIRYHGLGGRLNGPVDNPISSCISCHSQATTAEDYKPFNRNSGRTMPMANFSLRRENFSKEEFNIYFKNVKPGSYTRLFNNQKYINLDYSLQLAVGIRNYFGSLRESQVESTTNITNLKLSPPTEHFKKSLIQPLPSVTRGE